MPIDVVARRRQLARVQAVILRVLHQRRVLVRRHQLLMRCGFALDADAHLLRHGLQALPDLYCQLVRPLISLASVARSRWYVVCYLCLARWPHGLLLRCLGVAPLVRWISGATVIVSHVTAVAPAHVGLLLVVGCICVLSPVYRGRRFVAHFRTYGGHRVVTVHHHRVHGVSQARLSRSFVAAALPMKVRPGLENAILPSAWDASRIGLLSGGFVGLLLGHQHHLRHVDLLVENACGCAKGAVGVHVI